MKKAPLFSIKWGKMCFLFYIKDVERFWSWPTLTLFFTYPNPKTIRALLKKVLQLCTTFHCSTYTNFLVSNSTKSSFVLFRLPRRKVIHFHALKQIMKNVWKVGRANQKSYFSFKKDYDITLFEYPFKNSNFTTMPWTFKCDIFR